MHRFDSAADALARAILDYALERVRLDPPPLDHPRTAAELTELTGQTITAEGIGGERAFALFTDVLAPATLSVDHPRFWSFVPAAPTEAAVLFDVVVAASGIYGGSWLEGAGAVHAENQALRWLADLAGLPAAAGGVFVSGGTAGNLSALVAARHRWRTRHPARSRERGLIAAASSAHSSVAAAARVMDCDVVSVPADERGRLTGAALAATIDALEPGAPLFAIVATAGSTNAGVVDDLAGAADQAERLGIWFHVDGAYGLAALCAPSARHLFEGIDRADSFIVDPHKWLFTAFDCCALVYRDPAQARAAHTQHAEYLDVLTGADEWNPSDFAHHLSRRPRGLPFWFSLATYGTDAYRDAVESALLLTQATARMVEQAPHLQLVMEPELSVVMFQRDGWSWADYQAWSDQLLADQLGFVVPSSWHGEPVLRLCFINPRTTMADVRAVLETLS